jgi:hypothetical protein
MNMDLSELLAKHDQADFLNTRDEGVPQPTIEADVEGITGADAHKHRCERATWTEGYPERALDTRLVRLNPREPKLRRARRCGSVASRPAA